MNYGSVCSGIEAATVAWHPLGWNASWFAEIEAFPSAVLAHHYPNVPNLGDMTMITEKVLSGEVEAPDLLVGGTPCQAFSVAGLRTGLSDSRGKLTIRYVELINAVDTIRRRQGKPECIVVWENVPGVLSSKDNAFGCFLGALCGEEQELVPSGEKWTNAGAVSGPKRQIAWRILDAQHFGVAQRRKRVFVIASARKNFDPSKILFEWEGVRRDIAPSRETREEVTGNSGINFAQSGFGHYRLEEITAGTIKASGGNLGGGSENIVLSIADDVTPKINTNIAFTLSKTDNKCPQAVYGCLHETIDPYKVGTITKSYGAGGVDLDTKPLILKTNIDAQVRRLTPVECERLQGFPDNYTQIPYRNKSAALCPDGPRYQALGNSMATVVMKWIGQRINGYIQEVAA